VLIPSGYLYHFECYETGKANNNPHTHIGVLYEEGYYITKKEMIEFIKQNNP